MNKTIGWMKATLCVVFCLAGLFIAASETKDVTRQVIFFIGFEFLAVLFFPKEEHNA